MGKRDRLTLMEAAKDYCQKQHKRWDVNVKLYKGEITEFRSKRLQTWQHLIEVNMTRPIIDTMLPNIIFRTPKIMMRTGTEIADAALQGQALMLENEFNAMVQELNFAREYKLAALDALIFDVGWVKHGLTTDSDVDEDNYAFVAPFARRASPWDVWPDPFTRDPWLRDAGYLCHRSVYSMAVVKKSKMFDAKKLTPTGIINTLPQHLKEQLNQKNTPLDVCEIIEFWDREDNVLVRMNTNGEQIADTIPWPYDLKGMFPLNPVRFQIIPEQFYGKGETEYVYPYQLEISEKRTQQLNHTRRFNRKYRAGMDLSKADEQSLTEGEDGTVVRSKEPIEPIADAPLSVDLHKEIEYAINELKEVTGIGAYQRGGNESAVYSATAAKIIDNAANIKIEERRDAMKEALQTGAKLLYQMMKKTKSWPDREFKFLIDITTMQRPDDEGRRQQLIMMGQMMEKFPQFNVDNWLKDLSLAFMKMPNQYLKSPQQMQQEQQDAPPPPEVMKAQIEMQALQQKMQMDAQKAQMDMEVAKQEAMIQIESMKQEMNLKLQEMNMKIQFEREKMGMEREKIRMGIQQKQVEGAVDMQQQQNEMEMGEQEHRMNMSHSEDQHRMNMSQAQDQHRMGQSQSQDQHESKLKQGEDMSKAKVAQTKAMAKAKPKGKK